MGAVTRRFAPGCARGDTGHRRSRYRSKAIQEESMADLARKSIPLVLSFAAVLASAALSAQAAERYPNRPVRLVLPFPPGGSTDYNARAIQDKLSELLGEQLIVDNRSGASGQIGTRIAARSAPDGYTLL